ncbi:MAG: ADP-ribosylation factor-like protein [Nitrososphaerales archaeon]
MFLLSKHLPPTNMSYKIILVGDSGVGKTCYINRIVNGTLSATTRTLGVEVTPVYFRTHSPDGTIVFNVWDCSTYTGQLRPEDYWGGANGAIVMYDRTKASSQESVHAWIERVRATCGPIPIVVCGNKAELPVSAEWKLRKLPDGIVHCLVSGEQKSWKMPFKPLLRTLRGNKEVSLALAPFYPVIYMDKHIRDAIAVSF